MSKWKRDEIIIRDGKVLRFIEEELEGEKWEILGAAPALASPDVVREIVAWLRSVAPEAPGPDGIEILTEDGQTLEWAAREISRRFGSGASEDDAPPTFKPCVLHQAELHLTQMVLSDTFIVWRPWTAGGVLRGLAIDLGYNVAGDLVGITVWDDVHKIAPLPPEEPAA